MCVYFLIVLRSVSECCGWIERSFFYNAAYCHRTKLPALLVLLHPPNLRRENLDRGLPTEVVRLVTLPNMGADIELEPDSLIAKFRKGPLVPQVQERGWLGLTFPFPPSKEMLDNLSCISVTLTDGGEEKHEFTFNAPWPTDDEKSLIVAKHVRKP